LSCFNGSFHRAPHQVYDFGEDLLDRFQVRAVGAANWITINYREARTGPINPTGGLVAHMAFVKEFLDRYLTQIIMVALASSAAANSLIS
jgi:hypothetical protein